MRRGAIWGCFKKSLEEREPLAVDVRDRRSSKESIKPKSGEENQRRYKIKSALSMRNRSGEKKQWFRSRINNKELCRCELRAWFFCSKDISWRIRVVCIMFWSHERNRRQAVRRKFPAVKRIMKRRNKSSQWHTGRLCTWPTDQSKEWHT